MQQSNLELLEETSKIDGFSNPHQGQAPMVLDIEASGFGVGSYPIEIGVAMPDGQVYQWLIKPAPDWTHWRPEAEAVHGISRAQLDAEGLPIREVATALNRLVAGNVVFSDGWGVDSSWLALLYHEAGFRQHFRLDSIYSLLNEVEIDFWTEFRHAVTAAHGNVRHRAGLDAEVCQKTYMKIKAQHIKVD